MKLEDILNALLQVNCARMQSTAKHFHYSALAKKASYSLGQKVTCQPVVEPTKIYLPPFYNFC
jgi:hypothetical protein